MIDVADSRAGYHTSSPNIILVNIITIDSLPDLTTAHTLFTHTQNNVLSIL